MCLLTRMLWPLVSQLGLLHRRLSALGSLFVLGLPDPLEAQPTGLVSGIIKQNARV